MTLKVNQELLFEYLLEDVWMTEFVHELDLLEHVITVGSVLVQLEHHHPIRGFVSDL